MQKHSYDNAFHLQVYFHADKRFARHARGLFLTETKGNSEMVYQGMCADIRGWGWGTGRQESI